MREEIPYCGSQKGSIRKLSSLDLSVPISTIKEGIYLKIASNTLIRSNVLKSILERIGHPYVD